MKALYFASVRERIGIAEEEITPPPGVITISDLMAWLRDKGEGYDAAFANKTTIRTALDRTHARHDAILGNAQEVAFFPPMTGG
jgi:molybdopterin synthase sulfur carrier subunit